MEVISSPDLIPVGPSPAPASIQAVVTRLLSQPANAEQLASHLAVYREAKGLSADTKMSLGIEVSLIIGEPPPLAG